jgi:glycosyltransferase involved in cell wall biosynthesis
MRSRPTVLSIQTNILGNEVYNRTLRTHFERAGDLSFVPRWLGEGRTLPERLLYRAMDVRLPGKAVARSNVDLRRARNEAATAMLARGLVTRHVRTHGPPDVLHFHTQVLALMSTDWMRRLPTVLTTDATALNHVALEDQPPWTHRPSIALDRRAFRAAARCVFWSQWAADSAAEGYGLDPDRVLVIPPGVPVHEFQSACPSPPPSGSSNPVRLLFVGNRLGVKGGYDLMEVFRESLVGRAELHIATGDALGEVPPGVTVHRGVRAYTPEWFALYAASDVFVLPTKTDPFGLVFIEAMAAGLPVVGTNVNAVPEIVEDGVTGLLVPPGDPRALAQALGRLVDAPDTRRQMGAAGRARAAELFDMATNVDRLGDCFRTVAGER